MTQLKYAHLHAAEIFVEELIYSLMQANRTSNLSVPYNNEALSGFISLKYQKLVFLSKFSPSY